MSDDSLLIASQKTHEYHSQPPISGSIARLRVRYPLVVVLLFSSNRSSRLKVANVTNALGIVTSTPEEPMCGRSVIAPPAMRRNSPGAYIWTRLSRSPVSNLGSELPTTTARAPNCWAVRTCETDWSAAPCVIRRAAKPWLQTRNLHVEREQSSSPTARVYWSVSDIIAATCYTRTGDRRAQACPHKHCRLTGSEQTRRWEEDIQRRHLVY